MIIDAHCHAGRGDLMTARGVQMEAVETYRATLLTAMREGEDALMSDLNQGRGTMTAIGVRSW